MNGVDQSRYIDELKRQNLTSRMAEFDELYPQAWLDRQGGGTVHDSGHADEHGERGTMVFVGPRGVLLVDYVYDKVADVKRWTKACRPTREVKP